MEASINNIKKKPALFILGLPRSGTTLLEQMLDAHSQVTVCPEMYSGMTLWRLNAAKEISDKWKHLLIINYYYQRTNLFEDPINRCLARQAIREFKFPISTNTWYDALIADYLKEKNGTRFGEKTPENTFFVPTLEEAIPESQFIMILRNPFDIVVSLTEAILSLNNSPLPNRRLYHFAVTVKRGLKNMQSHHLPQKLNLLRITYEGLIRNPEVVLQQICTFLDIHFEPGMLAFQNRKKYARDKEVMRQILGRLDEPLTDQRINRSYSILSPAQYAYLQAYWAPELKLLPYDFPIANTTLSLQMKMHLYVAKLAFYFKTYLWTEYKNKLRFQCHYYAILLLRHTFLKNRIFKNLIINGKDWENIIDHGYNDKS